MRSTGVRLNRTLVFYSGWDTGAEVNDYRLHELTGDEMETVVIHLCREVLGTGTVNFSEGKDGGRDGRFHGTANKFPSEASPWKGKFIIQSKRTSNPIAKCADDEFTTLIDKEIVKLKALIENGEIDAYLLFTNRRMTAGIDAKLKKYIQEQTGLELNEVLGLERIASYLDAHPNVMKICGLDRFKGPLIIHPDELAEVIKAFHDHKEIVTNGDGSKFSFEYTELENGKNKINGLSADYFEAIKENSDPYFPEIHRFLTNPINEDIADVYYTLADEFKTKIAAHRHRFDTFDLVLADLYDQILLKVPALMPRRRLVNVFLHFMYCNCDIGRRK